MRFINIALGVSTIAFSLAWHQKTKIWTHWHPQKCQGVQSTAPKQIFYRVFEGFGKGFSPSNGVQMFYENIQKSSVNISENSEKLFVSPGTSYSCGDHIECLLNLVQVLSSNASKIVIHGENTKSVQALQGLQLDKQIQQMKNENICLKFFDTVFHPTIMHGFHPDLAAYFPVTRDPTTKTYRLNFISIFTKECVENVWKWLIFCAYTPGCLTSPQKTWPTTELSDKTRGLNESCPKSGNFEDFIQLTRSGENSQFWFNREIYEFQSEEEENTTAEHSMYYYKCHGHHRTLLNVLVAKMYDFDSKKYVLKSTEELDFLRQQEDIFDENAVRKSGIFRYNKREKIKMKPLGTEEKALVLNCLSIETGGLNSVGSEVGVLVSPSRNYTKRKEVGCVKCIRVRHSNRHIGNENVK